MRILLQHATRYRIRPYGTLSSPPTPATQTVLQRRITEALQQNAQIVPVLQQWHQQGNQFNPSHVRDLITKLRDSNQSLQALQVSEWMSEGMICNLIPQDFAARLHLIDSVVGLEEAEKFFESIPISARDGSVYTSLLSSYARSDKTLCKTEATFQKMKDLGLLSRPSPYNAVISLYSSLKDRDKVGEILREMQGNDVDPDSVTVNHVLKLCSAISDIEGMEEFYHKWKIVDGITLEWATTLDMAKAYLRSGFSSRKKLEAMLTLTEQLVDPKSSKQAYELLMEVYGEARKKEELLRIWNLYKKNAEHCCNKGYRAVISSLLKVHDIAGAEEIYNEWESSPLEFDIKIPTMLAYGYRQRGMMAKADKLMNNRTIKNNRMSEPITPVLQQWGNQMKGSDLKRFIKTLHESNQFSKALQVSNWMSEKSVCSLYSEDYATRLHLVATVLGLEEAEKFFETIPENMKDYSVYATLLNSYTKSGNCDKARVTFKKMRELGFLLKLSPYNSMISLYKYQEDMVTEILREMEENSVVPDNFTVNNVLRVYAAAESKVEAMEKYMKLWGNKDGIKLERGTMVAIAEAYAIGGWTRKAIEMYSDVAGSKREVYQLWNECKEEKKVEDSCQRKKVEDEVYQVVISSLLKLDDVQGAEKVYGDWKPNGPKLDLSIPGLLIARFCAEGNSLKVEELLKSIGEKRKGMQLRMLVDFTVEVVANVLLFCFLVGSLFLFLNILP